MQTVPDRFTDNATADVRKLAYELRMSFSKQFDDTVEFFTLNSSELDGDDLLAPSDGDILQEWDYYDYADYSDRVIQMEWSREEDIPFSVSQAIADITLKNEDNYFTRGSSALDPNILPRRPLRILSGFRQDVIPQFVGLTETVPKVDKGARTASVHAMDFLSFLFSKPLDQTVMLQNVTTDEVLDYLFQLFGLSDTQYVLDEGINEIKFVYWEKGKKLGEAIRELMQAELGSLYMDELGIIRFRNRFKSNASSVATFDSSNINDYEISDESKIINVVEITANVRTVQANQTIYTLSEPTLISGTQDVFFELSDPATSVDETVSFLANSQADGTGTNLSGNISVDDVYAFATSVKVTFTNSGTDAYLTELELTGTPAKQVGEPLYVRVYDQDSIDEFEEQVFTVQNDFIQSKDAANSFGLSLINYYKDFGNTITINVKGNPALQLGDNIDVAIDEIDETYTITKIENTLENSGRYTQRITGKIFNTPTFFTLSSDATPMSLLDGEDVLAF